MHWQSTTVIPRSLQELFKMHDFRGILRAYHQTKASDSNKCVGRPWTHKKIWTNRRYFSVFGLFVAGRISGHQRSLQICANRPADGFFGQIVAFDISLRSSTATLRSIRPRRSTGYSSNSPSGSEPELSPLAFDGFSSSSL